MTDFRLLTHWMFFTGLRNGKISILFFESEQLPGVKKGDLVTLYWDKEEEIKLYLKEAKPIVFRYVTDEQAQKAGFATKELLSYYLMQKYNLTSYRATVDSHIPDRIFYILEFVDDPTKIDYSDGETYRERKDVKGLKSVYYAPTVNTYNPEYDEKPWEDIL